MINFLKIINLVGLQADSKRWPAIFDPLITGVVYLGENGTGDPRIFLALGKWEDSITILLNRVQDRQLYVGGFESVITKKPVGGQITLKDAYAKGYIFWPKKGQKWQGKTLPADYFPSAHDEQDALGGVNLAIAYFRSWKKGNSTAWPSQDEGRNFLSMYRQAVSIFL
ncbi:hypothetical protein [Chitinophaga sp.]|uniref:hypothetical protein n=1 Tax=Chitinophaga sp. TaxID=1869181 RepID=UPI0031D09027